MRRKLWRNRRGQGLTEYALLICLVSLGLILLLGRFRNAIGNSLKNSTVAANSMANIQQAGGGTNGNGNSTNGNGNGNNGNGNGNNGNGNGNNGNGNNGNGNGNNGNGGPFIFGSFIFF